VTWHDEPQALVSQRNVVLFSVFVSLITLNATAQTGAYPAKPVKVIIPFPPGGTLDTVGRMLAQKLTEQMGQTFIVENRPGGNGTIGGDAVAKATADGYTLLFNASTFVSCEASISDCCE
jgi:tripartite-type tricarboxylate transporter receptor subunit TctC